MQTMGFHLMESPDILAPEKRSYEEEDYPERDGVKIYPYTVDKAFEYTVKLLYFGELETMNSAIRSLWNSFFEPTNNGDVKKALPVTIYNLYKGVKIVGYPTKMPGSETIVQVMQGAFIFELTLYVAEPNKCNFNYKTTAKYGKNNYFDGVILPEPKEEMLRRMAKGVKMGYGQSITSNSVTALIGSPVPIGTGDFTLEYFGNSYGSTTVYSSFMFNAAHRDIYSRGSLFVYSISGKGIGWIVFEKPSSGDPLLDSIDLITGETGTPFHFVLTRNGTTVKAYFNGELKATKKQSAVKDLGDFRLGMANSSNMVMSRIYNYALSAEEVAAHYNDGDPAGYVLPNAMKELTPVEIVGKNSYTWTGVDDPAYSYAVRCSRYFKISEVYKMRVTISDYEAGGAPFFKISTADTVILSGFNGDGTYELYLQVKGTPYQSVFVYAGPTATDRRMTITVDSIEPVGCVAEYLPQNLIPTAEGSVVQWLDSAPQLPEANGILPPLDASVGGYDLAAIGNPKIII